MCGRGLTRNRLEGGDRLGPDGPPGLDPDDPSGLGLDFVVGRGIPSRRGRDSAEEIETVHDFGFGSEISV